MNISKTLLSLSLLLSMPVVLHAMDKHEIKEDYKSELKDLSVTVCVQQTSDAQKRLAAATMQAFSTIATEHTNILRDQNNLAEQYETTIKLQDDIAQRDFELQTRRSELKQRYAEIQQYLPQELKISFDTAIEAHKLPILPQQEPTQSAETSTKKSFWQYLGL